MRFDRNLIWKVSWYRQSELEGALLLGRLVRQADSPDLAHELTRHAADEARHAWLWERARRRLGMPFVQILRSYQSFYMDETGPPRTLAEVLALTHVFEHRVDRQLTEDLEAPDLPEEIRTTLRTLLRDEQRHLSWIAEWLEHHPDRDELLARYRRADERVYERLHPYRHRIADIPGLGKTIETERGHSALVINSSSDVVNEGKSGMSPFSSRSFRGVR